MSNEITILGGGPAGLGAGYFLRRANEPFRIYEAGARVGGNCSTFQRGDFRFDTGAHRFHDKDPEITEAVTSLMGDELIQVSAPSAIYSHGRFFDFPLSPLNLIRNLGVIDTTRAALDWLRARTGGGAAPDFESMVVGRYGRLLAGRFLLSYSEKLWGLPPNRLSTRVSGGRLKGLTLKTFLLEGLAGSRKKTAHLDSSFYYPRSGYGAIAERLADACGRERVHLEARVTAIHHDGARMNAVSLHGRDPIPVSRVISTLPLPLFLRMMNPPPPDSILEDAARLQFRDVMLVGMILQRPGVMNYATVYFPDGESPITRVCEPRNRSPHMSPEGMTSLMAEIPCHRDEMFSGEALGRLEALVVKRLASVGWFSPDDVRDTFTLRLPFAYPMLESGIEDRVERMDRYLDRFGNLILTGRNARFQYAHLHDMLHWGKHAAETAARLPVA